MLGSGLTISVPVGQWWQVGQVGDHHHGARQADGASLHSEADGEALQQGDLQLAGVHLCQVWHWVEEESYWLYWE